MNNDQNQEPTVVKLQSDQFIIGSIAHTTTVSGDSKQYEVDLARQNCQCTDFEKHRSSFPIGDPRRFCSHLVAARCERLDDLPPFLQSLLEAHESTHAGLPNGASFAFFEVGGRLGFYSENRDQTAYFFLTGVGGSVFYEYVYDRKKKKWLNGKSPDSPDQLLVFAFKERGKFVTPKKVTPAERRKRRRRRSKPAAPRETSTPVKYLFLLLVAVGLVALGYAIFKGPYDRWVAAANAEDDQEQVEPPPRNEIPKDMRKRVPLDALNNNLDDPDDLDNSDDDTELPNNETESDTDDDESSNTSNEDENSEPKLTEPEFREWKTVNDKFSVIAKYKYYQNGTVVIERQDNGKIVKIDETLLRPEDQEYTTNIRRERRLQRARNQRNNDEGENSSDH